MSLPTKERLNEALEFFHSLDLTSMAREAEAVALRKKKGKGRTIEQGTEDQREGEEEGGQQSTTNGPPKPFTISLESLHALPRARAATVLHAAPVDSTSRLYPFCEMLRDKFLEAGFLVGEYKNNNKNQSNTTEQQSQCAEKVAEDQSNLLDKLPTDPTAEPASIQSSKLTTTQSSVPKPKPRPLLLHATVVNTIYVKRRHGPSSNNNNNSNNRGNRNHRTTRYSFDARDMLAHYRDYYLDSLRSEPKGEKIALQKSIQGREGENAGDGALGSENESGNENENNRGGCITQGEKETYPFVWARDFPLESICICEMGAKKLNSEDDATGLNGRLGEKYTVVSERGLDFGSA
ncbi:hypothetical protein PHISCL_06125 [Aspergillus sclerotialis]|uniref:A-kinase anchor protein 7-like phosphoesterase domain-containing protein n=1 Tax=Aspergillus sclerotialis TaxID=2070753 RepID=A0A3A2ZH06_9EURO|nr:hypothetical protein PHISCL_06125 [Aspergillus sclerotialis]